MASLRRFTSPFLWALLLLLVGLTGNERAGAQASGGPYPYSAYLPVIGGPPEPNAWIGPDGGSVVSQVADPTNSNVYYAGTWGAGVFKSTDGGATWQFAGKGLGNLLIDSMAIDPKHSNVVYAGTHWGGVYKTVNGGQSWAAVNNGFLDSVVVYTLAVNPGNTNLLYAGTRSLSGNGGPPWDGILYKSVDAGASWSPVLQNVGGPDAQDWIYSIAVDPNKPETVFAASHEHGPYRSQDYGSTWGPSGSGTSDGSGRAVAVDPRSSQSNTAYFAVWHRVGVFKTTNLGDTWNLVSSGLSLPQIYPNGIAIAPSQPDTIYMADFNGNGVWKSTNAGSSWNSVGLGNDLIYSVAANPSNSSTALAGTLRDGMYKTTNGGGSWTRSQTGIDNTQVTGMVFPLGSSVYGAVMGGGVFQSLDHGATWAPFNGGLGNKNVTGLYMHPTSHNILFALTQGGLYRIDLNNPSSWALTSANLPLTSGFTSPSTGQVYPPGYPFNRGEPGDELLAESGGIQPLAVTASLLSMAFAPSNPSIAYLGSSGSGVYASLDGGSTWNPDGLSGYQVWSIAVDPQFPNHVYAATGTTGVIQSTIDGGKNWSVLSLPGLSIYTLAMTPDVPGALFAGTSNGLWKYSGGAWTQIGFVGLSVTQLAVDPHAPEWMYAGTNWGAYVSASSGAYWSWVSDDFIGVTIQSINFDLNDTHHVYFGTTTHGTLRVRVK